MATSWSLNPMSLMTEDEKREAFGVGPRRPRKTGAKGEAGRRPAAPGSGRQGRAYRPAARAAIPPRRRARRKGKGRRGRRSSLRSQKLAEPADQEEALPGRTDDEKRGPSSRRPASPTPRSSRWSSEMKNFGGGGGGFGGGGGGRRLRWRRWSAAVAAAVAAGGRRDSGRIETSESTTRMRPRRPASRSSGWST